MEALLVSDYAITNYNTQSTKFYNRTFQASSDVRYLVFLHEFRHLMDENHMKPSEHGPGSHPDAEKWARDFIEGKCECE